MTQNCRAPHKINLVMKFTDDAAVVGLITLGDKSTYRLEVEDLTRWCEDINLILNIQKTKDMVVLSAGLIPPHILSTSMVQLWKLSPLSRIWEYT